MKTTRILLIVIALAFASAIASGQNTPAPATTPQAPTANSGDVIWYGKAPPGWGGAVTDMKQLAPGVGWAQRGGRLYRTTDNGTNWKDITPPIQGSAATFFLDTNRGWATSDERISPSSDELQFDIASTTDTGAAWSVTHATLSLKDYDLSRDAVSYYEASAIVFADPFHGWMNIRGVVKL
jgi:hypothetical protein